MEIGIIIDGITNCLVERSTGREFHTEYRLHDAAIKKSECHDWNFDWREPQKAGYSIYELFIENSDLVQGRVALQPEQGFVFVSLVESAPHNVSHTGKYLGTGAHLFAIACQLSIEYGFDGYVSFIAKTKLIKHYQASLRAIIIGGQRMAIPEDAARFLVKKYLGKPVK